MWQTDMGGKFFEVERDGSTIIALNMEKDTDMGKEVYLNEKKTDLHEKLP